MKNCIKNLFKITPIIAFLLGFLLINNTYAYNFKSSGVRNINNVYLYDNQGRVVNSVNSNGGIVFSDNNTSNSDLSSRWVFGIRLVTDYNIPANSIFTITGNIYNKGGGMVGLAGNTNMSLINFTQGQCAGGSDSQSSYDTCFSATYYVTNATNQVWLTRDSYYGQSAALWWQQASFRMNFSEISYTVLEAGVTAADLSDISSKLSTIITQNTNDYNQLVDANSHLAEIERLNNLQYQQNINRYDQLVALNTKSQTIIDSLRQSVSYQQRTTNAVEEQNIRDDQDKAAISGQQSDVDNSSASSGQQAQSTGTTLLAAFSSFVTAITSASPTNCVIDMDMGNLDLGPVNFCQLSPPPQFQALASIFLIVFCVPLSIATARKVINLFRSFQN